VTAAVELHTAVAKELNGWPWIDDDQVQHVVPASQAVTMASAVVDVVTATGVLLTAAAPSPDRLEALRDAHCWITSVDTCCHCSDGECDGIGCITAIDPDKAGAGDTWHFERLENLHEQLRQGRAWRAMQAVLAETNEPATAITLANEALAIANNQPVAAISAAPALQLVPDAAEMGGGTEPPPDVEEPPVTTGDGRRP
jgi:hypothetical protein